MFLGKEIRLKRLLNKNLAVFLQLPWIIRLHVVYYRELVILNPS